MHVDRNNFIGCDQRMTSLFDLDKALLRKTRFGCFHLLGEHCLGKDKVRLCQDSVILFDQEALLSSLIA